MLLGGFFVDNIPSWLEWLQAVSFIRYPYGLLIKLQYPAGESADCRNNQGADDCFLRDYVPNDTIERKKWEDAVALLVFLIFSRTAVYVRSCMLPMPCYPFHFVDLALLSRSTGFPQVPPEGAMIPPQNNSIATG
jgi:hypothetical protein